MIDFVTMTGCGIGFEEGGKLVSCYGGDESARYDLGILEGKADYYERALKHHMIAVRGGYDGLLHKIRVLYTDGHATIDDDIQKL